MAEADPVSGDLKIDVIPAGQLGEAERLAWTSLRARNRHLWSPFFDLRLFDVLARHVPQAHLAIAHDGGTIAAFLPFQGKRGTLGRPLGAPLADQHGLIQAEEQPVSLAKVVQGAGLSGFNYSGLVAPLGEGDGDDKTPTHPQLCHVADVSVGKEAYIEARRANFPDHVKKTERRKARGIRDYGAMAVDVLRHDRLHFDLNLAWKAQQFIETNRHNVLGSPWVRDVLESLHSSTDPDFVGEVVSLRFGDHLVAMEFGLRAGPVIHSWLPTFDRAYGALAPGLMLMDAMIESAAERGLSKVDLGAGHGDYKRHAANYVHILQSGQVRVSPGRKWLGAGLQWAERLAINSKVERLAGLPGKIARRSEIILATEHTLPRRLAGFRAALKQAR
jgi:CelD/BcsL family acetyltransferase involved in cellulose biosynthesis